jgi:hypothetical protein
MSGLDAPGAGLLMQLPAKILQQRLNIFDVHQQPVRLLAFRGPEGKGIGRRSRGCDPGLFTDLQGLRLRCRPGLNGATTGNIMSLNRHRV